MGTSKRLEAPRQKARQDPTDMSMMRIAVAGTGGLARLIAHYIDEDTSHHVVFLSRTPQLQLSSAGYQVAVIDYNDADRLRFVLRGIDTVISTVTGPNQVLLIQAAVAARVRRFAPAEFEGPPQLRAANDPLDRGRTVARQWLEHFASNIQSTAFVCGILYERFQPGGLAQSQIGMTSGLSGEGDYIMNCRRLTAQAPAYDHNNESNATICMTAAQDVARFVTQSLDLRTWPSELRMHGQRIQVKDLVLQVQRLTGTVQLLRRGPSHSADFEPGRAFDIQWHGPITLRAEMQVAMAQNDITRQTRLRALMNTCEGRYDFQPSNLNQMFADVRPIDFETWFFAKWNPQQL